MEQTEGGGDVLDSSPMLAYKGILVEQTVGGGDVESSTSEQVIGCVRQTLVSLEDIIYLQETQTKQKFHSVISTSLK